ncbi:SDR family oxidoreductase [Streptomyces sp. NPDC001984]
MTGVLEGQLALVTGGGGGIGRVVARYLARAGATVAVADISLPAASEVADSLGGGALALELDVTAPDDVVAGVSALPAAPAMLVTAHGFPRDARLTDMSKADWDAVIEVCLSGTYNCVQAVAPGMIDRGYGRIVTISSRAWHGNPGQANYAAAKAGVVGLTRSVAKELGRKGVTANSIAPGLIDTPSLRGLPTFDAIADRAIRASSVKRLGEPEDVAETCLFLCGPGSGFITGEVIHVSGGRFG